MAKPDPDKPLYDALGFESSARFWRSLLSSDLGSKSGLDPEDVQLERRLVLYRLMLVIMLVASGTVLLGGLLDSDTPMALLAFAGLSCLCLAAATVQVYLKNGSFLPPIIALALTIVGVIWSVRVGAEQQQLWLFPLMISLTALLPFRAALVGGLMTLLALVLVQGAQDLGEQVAKNAA